MIKNAATAGGVVVYAGRDPLTGRKRQKTGPAATKAEARQLEARLISQVGAGQHGGTAGKTVADLLEAWFQWRPSVRPISPNTLVNYRRYADQKLLPARLLRRAEPAVPRRPGAGRRCWAQRQLRPCPGRRVPGPTTGCRPG